MPLVLEQAVFTLYCLMFAYLIGYTALYPVIVSAWHAVARSIVDNHQSLIINHESSIFDHQSSIHQFFNSSIMKSSMAKRSNLVVHRVHYKNFNVSIQVQDPAYLVSDFLSSRFPIHIRQCIDLICSSCTHAEIFNGKELFEGKETLCLMTCVFSLYRRSSEIRW